MKRSHIVALLMLLSSSAFAGDSPSFNIGGRRAPLEASRDCRSGSCAAPSPHNRDRYRDDDADDYYNNRYRGDRRSNEPTRALPLAPEVASPPPGRPAAPAQPPAVYRPAASSTQSVPAPLPPKLAVPPAPPPPPAPPLPIAKQAEPARLAPPPPQLSNNAEDDADAPVGDWQTESKGWVRITKCGKALCGYVLSSSSNDQGEVVLVNMKLTNEDQWSGSVYSQSSGDTYYGTMEMMAPNRLRVEACALGRFYCSGNNWTRINAKTESLMTSRPTAAEPRS